MNRGLPLATGVLPLLGPGRPTWAHHPGGGAEPASALGYWLFGAGVLAVLGMVGWAVLAPPRDDPPDPGVDPDR